MLGGGNSEGFTIKGVFPARVNSPPDTYVVKFLPSIGYPDASYNSNVSVVACWT